MLISVTPPTIPSGYLTSLKDNLGITSSGHDTRLTRYLSAAITHIERETGRKIGSQTWDYFTDCFPYTNRQYIQLPGPLSSITWIKYYDDDNTLQTWDVANYRTFAPTDTKGLIEAVDTWPTVYDRANAVNVRFVTGTTAPADLLQAVILLCGTWNEHREDQVTMALSTQDRGTERLIKSLRIRGYC